MSKSKKIQVNPRLESLDYSENLEILGYSRIYHLARIQFPAGFTYHILSGAGSLLQYFLCEPSFSLSSRWGNR